MIDADELIEEADKLGRRLVAVLNESRPRTMVQLIAVFETLLSVLGGIRCKILRGKTSRETLGMLCDVPEAAREQPGIC